MSCIAKEFHTYTTSIKRILNNNNIEIRSEFRKEGNLYVKDGEKLIEWAKAQDRLVTKTELAHVLGKKRLSPSYFIKYPELGQYIHSNKQQDIQKYSHLLYNWLVENDIAYKPDDRTRLKVSVDALLLGEYSDIAIQISEKPNCISRAFQEKRMKERIDRAKEAGIAIVFVNRTHFENLDILKPILNDLKKE